MYVYSYIAVGEGTTLKSARSTSTLHVHVQHVHVVGAYRELYYISVILNPNSITPLDVLAIAFKAGRLQIGCLRSNAVWVGVRSVCIV